MHTGPAEGRPATWSRSCVAVAVRSTRDPAMSLFQEGERVWTSPMSLFSACNMKELRRSMTWSISLREILTASGIRAAVEERLAPLQIARSAHQPPHPSHHILTHPPHRTFRAGQAAANLLAKQLSEYLRIPIRHAGKLVWDVEGSPRSGAGSGPGRSASLRKPGTNAFHTKSGWSSRVWSSNHQTLGN